MKQICLLASVIYVFGLTATAEAHFLATDGTIGVTMHTDPDDNLIAGQSGVFYFDIADKSGKFDLAKCACRVMLSESGSELSSQLLGVQGRTADSVTYDIPKTGAYHVRLVGTPKSGVNFQPFDIAWDLRVDRTAASKSSGNQIIGGALIAGLLAAAVFLVRRRRSRS